VKICKYCESAVAEEETVCPHCGARDFQYRCEQCGEVFESAHCPRCGLRAGEKPKVCPHCGTRYHTNACPNCGYLPVQLRSTAGEEREVRYVEVKPAVSGKSRLAALLLVLFLGVLGIHRFYVGKVGTGILYILTGGFFGIGLLIDLILILCGAFRDKRGLPVKEW
jgi:RNA polymerase subunit RPABC4/transcription elongation factor Spt4